MDAFEEDSLIDMFEARRKTKLGEKFRDFGRRFMIFNFRRGEGFMFKRYQGPKEATFGIKNDKMF